MVLLFGVSLMAPLVPQYTRAVTCDAGFTATNGVCIPNNTGLSSGTVSSVLVTFMTWLLYILGTLAIIAFVISGIMYLTSAGNDDQIDRAKEYMIWSIVGVIVAFSGLIIVTAIASFLSGSATF